MAFRWWADDGPLSLLFGSSSPSLIKNVVRVEPPLAKLSGSARVIIKLFSSQLSKKFQLFIKYRQIKKFHALSFSDVVFINCWHFNIYEQDKFCAQLS